MVVVVVVVVVVQWMDLMPSLELCAQHSENQSGCGIMRFVASLLLSRLISTAMVTRHGFWIACRSCSYHGRMNAFETWTNCLFRLVGGNMGISNKCFESELCSTLDTFECTVTYWGHFRNQNEEGEYAPKCTKCVWRLNIRRMYTLVLYRSHICRLAISKSATSSRLLFWNTTSIAKDEDKIACNKVIWELTDRFVRSFFHSFQSFTHSFDFKGWKWENTAG